MPFDINNQAALVNSLQSQINSTNAKNIQAAERQMAFQVAQNAKAMNFNAEQARINRDWQEALSNTSHQREVKDLIAAGLNPILSANAGASTPSGSAASGVSSAGSMPNFESGASAMSSLVNSFVNSAATMYSAETSAQAAVRSATISSEASKFIAEHYPNTAAGMISRLVEGMTGGLTTAGQSIANFFDRLLNKGSASGSGTIPNPSKPMLDQIADTLKQAGSIKKDFNLNYDYSRNPN